MNKKNNNNVSQAVVAFVALKEELLPSWASISSMLEENFTVDFNISNIEENQNDISGYVAGGVFSIASMPAPLPWEDIEGSCETAWYWPDATKEMRQHTAHLIITVMATKLDLIDTNLLLTKLVASTALAAKAIGIYWGSGTLVHSCDTFMKFNEDISREQLPLYNWIDFRVNQENNGNHTLFTTGLNKFDLMEIEMVDANLSPNDLINFAFNISHYLLDNGSILKDGNTIGMSETEIITIKYEPSIWDNSVKVYKLYV